MSRVSDLFAPREAAPQTSRVAAMFDTRAAEPALPPPEPVAQIPSDIPSFEGLAPISRVEKMRLDDEKAQRVEVPTLLDRAATFADTGVLKGLMDIPYEQLAKFGEFVQSPGTGKTLLDTGLMVNPLTAPLTQAIGVINSQYDLGLKKVGQEIFDWGQSNLERRSEEQAGKINDVGDLVLANAGESFGRMIPNLIVGPTAGLLPSLATIAYLSESSAELGALRDGHSPTIAKIYGKLNGIFEAGTEAYPMKTLLGLKPFRNKLGKFLLQEMGTEMANTWADHWARRIVLDEDLNLDDLKQDLAMTAATVVIAGGAQVGTVNTVQRMADVKQRFETLNASYQREAMTAKQEREYGKLQKEMTAALEEAGVDVGERMPVFHASPKEDITVFDPQYIDVKKYDGKGADAWGSYASTHPEKLDSYMLPRDGKAQLAFTGVDVEAEMSAFTPEEISEMANKIGFNVEEAGDPGQVKAELQKEAERETRRADIAEKRDDVVAEVAHGTRAMQLRNLLTKEDLGIGLADKGKMYTMLIDPKAPYLDWKKPLTRQDPRVQEILKEKGIELSDEVRGRDVYRQLQEREFNDVEGSSRMTSELLDSWGIKGTIDRRGGQGKLHDVYTFFDLKSPEIIELGAKQQAAKAVQQKMQNFDDVREELYKNPPPVRINRKIKNLWEGIQLSQEDMYKQVEETLAFDIVRKYTMGLEQLADDPKNRGFAPLQDYRNMVHLRHASWGKWAERASSRIEEGQTLIAPHIWNTSIKTEEQLNNLAWEVNRRSKLEGRRFGIEEIQDVSEEMGLKNLTPRHAAFLNEMFEDFQAAFEETQEVLFEKIDGITDNEAERAEARQKIRLAMEEAQNHNYLPKMRYGDYMIEIQDANENVVYREHFKKKSRQEKARERLEKLAKERGWKSPTLRLSVEGRRVRGVGGFEGVPDSFLAKLEETLDLTGQDLDSIRVKQWETTAAGRFANSTVKDDPVEGWEKNVLRNYASFMSGFANRVSGLKYDDRLQGTIEAAMNLGETVGANRTKREQIGRWMKEHKQYLQNPGNELAELRALGFTWYLGFVPKAAAVNLTQVPLVALPVLSKDYGTADATKALASATQEFFSDLRTGKGYSQQQQMAIQEARQQVLEENQGTTLGATANENRLQQASNGAFGNNRAVNRAVRKAIDGAAVMFQSAENFNRQITFTATYDLERAKGSDHATAVNKGIAAVRTTQFEYARFNRPELFRGKKSALFLFMQYLTSMMWLIGNSPAKWRILSMMILAGGLQGGIPGAENILDLYDGAMTSFKKNMKVKDPKTQSRRDMKEFLEGLMEDPDIPMMGFLRDTLGVTPEGFAELMMHGASKFVPNPFTFNPADPLGRNAPMGTVDVSGSLSIGRVIPGTELFNREMKADRAIAEGVRQVGGPLVNIPYALAEAAFTENNDVWRTMEKIMPTQIRNLTRIAKWAAIGEERDSQGDPVAYLPKSLLSPQAMAQGLGFAPTEINTKRSKGFDAYDKAAFYNGWRNSLLDKYYRAMKDGDRPRIKRIQDAILKDYNKMVPFPEMMITPDGLLQSLNTRYTRSAYKDAGVQQQKRVRRLYDEILGPDKKPIDYTDNGQP